MSYISFIALFLILTTMLFYITVYHVVIAYIVFMHEHLSFYIHTLIRSLLTPWIRTSRVLDIFLYCSGVHVIVCFARRLEFLSFDPGILASFIPISVLS